MTKKYRLNKNKTTLIIVLTILTLIISAVLMLLSDGNLSMDIGIICIGVIFFSVNIKNYMSEYTASLTITDCNLVSYRMNKEVKINWSEIKNIRYKGTKYFAISERIKIIGENCTEIIIDSVFENYLNVWSDVITKCKEENSKIIINNRIIERINKKMSS